MGELLPKQSLIGERFLRANAGRDRHDGAHGTLDSVLLARSGIQKLIGPAPTVVSFVTMAEIRYGALKAGWGDLRRRRLERDLTRFVAIKPDDHLIESA